MSRIAVVGGAGHVGLPLSLVLASKGHQVTICDTNQKALDQIEREQMPFMEEGAEPLLRQTLHTTLQTASTLSSISDAEYVIICVGTPVDEYLNPKLKRFLELCEQIKPYTNPNQVIIIRSTIYPGTTRAVSRILGENVCYCPERILQGKAIEEIYSLPQIVSGFKESCLQKVDLLFEEIAPQIIRAEPEEAEFAKLFLNAHRYIEFAIANQFYMMAEKAGVSYERIREIAKEGYPRGGNLASAGFAAGPCLLKDTMQLGAFSNNQFMLGHAAMLVNEGLPNFVASMLEDPKDAVRTVGILGMAFKGDNDDIRDSLSYKLGKILRYRGFRLLYSDEYAKDPTFIGAQELIEQADIVIIGCPHSAYRHLSVPQWKTIIDLWEILPRSRGK